MKHIFTLLFSFLTLSLFSQISLVKDLREDNNGNPSGMYVFDGHIFFSAYSADNGSELWVSNGTEDSTLLVKEINTDGNASPSFFFTYKNEFYFSANDGNGMDLFKSDGTEAGTVKVPVGTNLFNPKEVDSLIYFVHSTAGNRFYFFDGEKIDSVPNTGTATERVIGGEFVGYKGNILLYMGKGAEEDLIGRQLYLYDTEVDSFSLVKNLTDGDTDAKISNFTAIGDKVYFKANNGDELWVTDGTTMGTKEVESVDALDDMLNLFAWNDEMYFEGDDGNGDQLWKLKPGSTPSVEQIKELREGSSNGNPSNMILFNNEVYFSAFSGEIGSELWKTDGTEAGTILVKEINPDGNASPSFFFIYKEALYFSANAGNGMELYTTDGTAEGTVKVISGTNLFNPQLVDTTIYFVNSSAGNRLYTFDGEKIDTLPNAGTAIDKTIGGIFQNLNGNLLVYMGKGSEEDSIGRQLYLYDTAVDTFRLLADLTDGDTNAGISQMEVMNGKVYFKALSNDQMWVSDGTENGTYRIDTLSHIQDFFNLFAWNDALYFEGDDGTADQLWKYEAPLTPEVEIFKEFNAGSENGYPTNFFVTNNNIYFSATTAETGSELWKTDGTAEGTSMVKEINMDGNATPNFFFLLKDTVYFSANAGNGMELYKTDGTSEGTKKVLSGTMVFNPMIVNDIVYFVNTLDNNRLYTFDGVKADTIPNAGTAIDRTIGATFTNLNDNLLVYMGKGTEEDSIGRQLYLYDSEVDSFTLVKNMTEDDSDAGIAEMTHLNDKVYFKASGSKEIWVTDGTEPGTYKIDAVNGMKGIGSLHVWNDALYFEGDDGNGDDLWQYTPATDAFVNLSQLYTAGGSNKNHDPSDFVAYGDYLYYRGEDASDTKGHLWRTDGETVEQMNSTVVDVDDIVLFQDKLFMEAENDTSANEMFTFDFANLKEEKVSKISDIESLGGDNVNHDPSDFRVIGDYMYYRGEGADNSNGYLWRTDGENIEQLDKSIKDVDEVIAIGDLLIVEGDNGTTGNELYSFNLNDYQDDVLTQLSDLKSLDGSNINHDPSDFAVADGYLYYRGEDEKDSNGHLWRTNGTEIEQLDETIKDVDDIVFFKGKIYFEGDDGVLDNELYVYDPAYNAIERVSAKNSNLTLYPNPSNGQVKIKGEQLDNATYTIFDLNGRTIEKGSVINETINYNLSSGIYFIEINNQKQLSIHKITVK